MKGENNRETKTHLTPYDEFSGGDDTSDAGGCNKLSLRHERLIDLDYHPLVVLLHWRCLESGEHIAAVSAQSAGVGERQHHPNVRVSDPCDKTLRRKNP